MTTTNLTSKFDALQQQLTTQQTTFMARLQYTNDLLGQILVALGQPVQAETTTLADVATILMAIHADTTSVDTRLLTLADIHLDTMSMDEKLLLIRNAISTPGEALPYTRFAGSYSSIAWNIQRISLAMGTVFEAGNPTNQVNLLDVLEYFKYYLPKILGKPIDNSGNGDSYRSMLYLLQGIFNGIGSDVDSAQLGVLLQTIISQLGAPLAGETIAQLIKDVDNHTVALIGTQPPPTGTEVLGSCDAEYSSTGLIYTPSSAFGVGSNLISPTWDAAPPASLGYPSTPGGLLHTEIGPSVGTWQEWHLYVESGAPYFAREFLSAERYPTNQWLEVGTDAAPLKIFIDADFALTVHLCPPNHLFGIGGGGGGGVDEQVCTNYTSIGWSDGREYISFGLNLTAGLQRDGDYFGYTVRLISTSNNDAAINVVYTDLDDNFGVSKILTMGAEAFVSVNVHTRSLGVYERFVDSTSSFNIEFCTPGPVEG